MRLIKKLCVLFAICSVMPIFAQKHISVPLDNQVYYILEQAQIRGLCLPLPSVKPYSQQVIINAINEIFETEAKFSFAAITEKERKILQETLELLKPIRGFDIHRFEFFYEKLTNKKNIRLSFNAGFMWNSIFGISKELNGGDTYFGTDDWFTLFLQGDVGESVSWHFSGSGGLIRAPIKHLGNYYPFYKGAKFSGEWAWHEAENEPFEVYSDVLTYFPYTYRKKWDGSVFHSENLSSTGFYSWPQSFAFGYNIMGEISASFLENRIFFRAGRFLREWGSETGGSSLVFNGSARPFVAVEGVFTPFSWLHFSALTGVLEYYNTKGLVESAKTFQNAFSIALVEIGYKNYIRFKFGTDVIWPKRFELGYPFPLNSNFFYQNNIGDFDNLGLYASLSAGLPGIGKAWFSFFADEFDLSSPDFFHQDRNMYAFQAGASFSIPIPFLPFTNIILQYTKLEPYVYTHQHVKVPWYGDLSMEEAYINNGVSLGYYLPPNSDELKVRIESMLSRDTNFHLQYQMIRHGADYGSRSVDGSSILSELNPTGRNSDPVLWKYFLHDGAYEWQHIIKVGANHTLSKMLIPVQLFFDAGLVMSYFTDIDGQPNTGNSYPFHQIDTSEYPKRTRIIGEVGFRIWPK